VRETVVLVGDEPVLPHLAEDLRRGGYDVVVNPGTEELPGEAALLGVFLSDPDERRRIVPTLVGPDGPPWRRVVVECEAEEGPALAEAGLVPFVPRLAPYRLAELLLRAPAGLRLLSGTLEEEVLVEVSVTNPTFRRRALRDLPLPADALVLAVSRGREWIIPRGPTRIEVGDVLTVVARSESAEKIRSLFAEER
jgi:hypothetical protein